MSATLENRIEHLFHDRGDCLKKIACLFAERRGQWLVQDEIIKLLGRNYADSTIGKNFKILSSPMNELNGHGYIETGNQRSVRGRPAIRGKLSQAASDMLFKSVASHTNIGAPAPLRIGKVIIPPVEITPDQTASTTWLLPNDIVALREQKIGEKNADRLLRDIANRKAAPGEATFATDYYGLMHHETPGPIPYMRLLTPYGLREFASDANRASYSLDIRFAYNWAGTWETKFGKLEIVDDHPRYTGTYPNGTIEGNVTEDTISLIGVWNEGANSGSFKFTMFVGGQSFWGDQYDGAHRKGWYGRMIG